MIFVFWLYKPGSLSNPRAMIFFQIAFGLCCIIDSCSSIDFFGRWFLFSFQYPSSSVERILVCIRIVRLLWLPGLPVFSAPSPPLAQTSATSMGTPNSLHLSATICISASVSVTNLFKATNGANIEFLHIFNSFPNFRSFSQCCRILFFQIFDFHASMVFQRPDRGDQNDGARIQTGFDTLDIEEFFCTQVKTETSLRDDKI